MSWPTHIVAAAGYVFDKHENILIVKTKNRGWDCTGGQVEMGENLEEAVLREIMEESGIKASVKCLCGVYSNVGSHKFYDGVTDVPTKVMFDFLCAYESGACRPSDETTEVIWVPKKEVMRYITSPAQIYRFKKALSFDGRVTYAAYVSKPDFLIRAERFI